jgi:hypothetical protein
MTNGAFEAIVYLQTCVLRPFFDIGNEQMNIFWTFLLLANVYKVVMGICDVFNNQVNILGHVEYTNGFVWFFKWTHKIFLNLYPICKL